MMERRMIPEIALRDARCGELVVRFRLGSRKRPGPRRSGNEAKRCW